MKIKKIICSLVLALNVINIYSQQMELKELSAPSSPAFTLLGLNPTSISRPTLGKPFIFSLVNGLDGSGVASDVAIESSPFWWKSRQNLSYEDYYGIDKAGKRGAELEVITNQIFRTFSVSVATSDAQPRIDTIDARLLAGGFRFQVLPGQPSQKFVLSYKFLQVDVVLKREAIDELISKLEDEEIETLQDLKDRIREIVLELITNHDILKVDPNRESIKENAVTYISNVLSSFNGSQGVPDSLNKFQLKIYLEKERQKLTDEVDNQLIEMKSVSRVGWLLEFAAAGSLLAPENNIDYTIGQEWAGWGTLTYRFDTDLNSKKTNEFNLMSRFGGSFLNTNSYNRDLGMSWVTSGENHSLTFEGIFRNYRTYFDITSVDGQVFNVSESENTYRFALSYQYKISDLLNLSLTAGKDFENSQIAAGGIFSLINFNFILPSQQSIASL